MRLLKCGNTEPGKSNKFFMINGPPSPLSIFHMFQNSELHENKKWARHHRPDDIRRRGSSHSLLFGNYGNVKEWLQDHRKLGPGSRCHLHEKCRWSHVAGCRVSAEQDSRCGLTNRCTISHGKVRLMAKHINLENYLKKSENLKFMSIWGILSKLILH